MGRGGTGIPGRQWLGAGDIETADTCFAILFLTKSTPPIPPTRRRDRRRCARQAARPRMGADAVAAHRLLHHGYVTSLLRHRARQQYQAIALDFGDEHITYEDLFSDVMEVASALQAQCSDDLPRRVAVLGQRTYGTYVGVLAALFGGFAFVPLNPQHPPSRTARVLRRSRCAALIVASDVASLDALTHPAGETATCPDDAIVLRLDGERSSWALRGVDTEDGKGWVVERGRATADDVAYLPFTSGSTGEPKGVRVLHRNLRAFVDWAVDRYDLSADDRFSHLFDTTFDLSLFDLFVAWEVGARVCIPTPNDMMQLDAYVRDRGITVWFSVPSVALLMQKRDVFHPRGMPNLRYALFCGEALPHSVCASMHRGRAGRDHRKPLRPDRAHARMHRASLVAVR